MSVASAAGLMLEHGVNRLPVVNGGGRLVGIVTRADLVRAFARTDEQIVADAREQIAMQQALAGDANAVDIIVKDGDAVITGAVRRRSDADVIPHLVRLVPGVVAVRSELTWSEKD
jgi:CBS domain-containing protein